MNTNTTIATPFEHIALAFSGGGFRAASFSLGILSYLDKVNFPDHTVTPTPAAVSDQASLLQKVHYISSASGGTITNACFALALAEGRTFNQFYEETYSLLKGDQVLQRALAILNDNAKWAARPTKSRNLINAFALCYDELLFHGRKLKDLQQPNTIGVPLDEVCFNTTEFFRGLPFLQNVKITADTADDDFFFYGNFYVHLDHQVSRDILIADMMAASSCFPMGFEPLRFPEDFAHKTLTTGALREGLQTNADMLTAEERDFCKDKNLGLMDGGITDNQGLDSMIKADTRRIKGETSFAPFDLLIVNDVGSQYMEPYKVPLVEKGGFFGRLTYNRTGLIFVLLSLLCFILLILGWTRHNEIVKALLFVAGGLLLGLSLAGIWVGQRIKRLVTTGPMMQLGAPVVQLLISFFRKTRLSVIRQMVAARINSAVTLNSDVFLKRVRSLIYDSFYANPQWANRRKANHVYDLSLTNDLNRQQHPPVSPIKISRDLQVLAEKAYRMPTTLWFDKEAEEGFALPCLITCGQFTTCYNLLDYTQRLLTNSALVAGLEPGYRQRLLDIQECLQNDMTRFNANPFWLFNQSKVEIGLSVVEEKIKYHRST